LGFSALGLVLIKSQDYYLAQGAIFEAWKIVHMRAKSAMITITTKATRNRSSMSA